MYFTATMFSPGDLRLVFVTAAIIGFTSLVYIRKSRKKLPPGPPSYPVIGSLFSWPSSQNWLTFTKWGEQYGEIVYANVAGTDIIILNSLKAAQDLLDNQGAVYSDRPRQHFANNIVGWKDSPIFCDASHKYFRPARTMMLNAVGIAAALEPHIRMEQHETRRFLRRLIGSPDDLKYHLRMLAGTFIMRIVYGHDVSPGRDEYVDLIERVNTDLNYAATPGNFLVDFIPLLEYVPRWFPGTSWMDMADRMRASVDEVLTKPMNLVREQLGKGMARPSFVSGEIERGEHGENVLAWTAEALYTGGADTVISALSTFFLCMTLFPEAQHSAQRELDSVTGEASIPTWEDRQRLPYVNALIKEMLRWAPVAPQALPHSASESGVYKGYFIPKGTIVIPNVWAFTRDPSIYVNPDQFKPERFLGPSPEKDPHDFVFGFGRRVCPGEKLARATLFLVVSNALATLSIDRKLDASGQPIIPEVEYFGGAVVHPTKLECAISPRNARTKELIMGVDDVPYEA